MIKDKEIWYWYTHVKKQLDSNFSASIYCKMNNLDRTKFYNLKERCFYMSISNPKEYAKRLQDYADYKNSALNKKDFCKDRGIKLNQLTQIQSHLRHLEAIKRMPENYSNTQNPVNFIKVKAPFISKQPEIIQDQNDIEIAIRKGIKVVVSPNIDNDKIIRIIQLLKDL